MMRWTDLITPVLASAGCITILLAIVHGLASYLYWRDNQRAMERWRAYTAQRQEEWGAWVEKLKRQEMSA